MTISIGVGPSRLVAKCCSDHGEPAGLVAMGREEACERFATAPTSRVPMAEAGGAPRGAGPAHDRPAPARGRGPPRRPLRHAHRGVPEGARGVPRRLAGGDGVGPREVLLERDDLRRGRRRPRRARVGRAADVARAVRGARQARAPRPDDRDQGAPRGLDHGHPRALGQGANQRRRARHRHGAGAASRLLAAEAGTADGRADRVLRGRDHGPAARSSASSRWTSRTGRRRACGARLAQHGVLDAGLVQHADDRAAQVVAALGVLVGDGADQPVQPLLEGAVVDGGTNAPGCRVGLSRRRVTRPISSDAGRGTWSSPAPGARSPRPARMRPAPQQHQRGAAEAERTRSSASAHSYGARLLGLGDKGVEEALDLHGRHAAELSDDLAVLCRPLTDGML